MSLYKVWPFYDQTNLWPGGLSTDGGNLGFPKFFLTDLANWCLYRHQCDLPEHFGKKTYWLYVSQKT